jgi:hypothetical protein
MAEAKPKTVVMSVRVLPDLSDALKALADKRGIKMNAMLVEALEAFVAPPRVSLKPGQFGVIRAPETRPRQVGERRPVGFDPITGDDIYRDDLREGASRESGKPRASSSPICPVCAGRHPVGANHTWGKK